MSRIIDVEIRKANGLIIKRLTTRRGYYAYVQRGALTRTRYQPPGARILKSRPARRRLDPDAIYKVPVDGKSPWAGAKHPLVTIVLYSDFQCPYCKWAACILQQLLKAYPKRLKLVFKNNPLAFHRKAMGAAEAAREAYAQKGNRGFWKMHAHLFPMASCRKPLPHIRTWLKALPRDPTRLSASHLRSAARAVGLKMSRFDRAMKLHIHQKRLKAEQAWAVQLGARGTPSFFINGLYFRGIRPLARLKLYVDEEIRKAKRLMRRKRISRRQLYNAIIKRGATKPVFRKP